MHNNEHGDVQDVPRLLSAAQLARAWALTEGTIRRWAREGKLPAVRIGSEWRFPADRLRAMVREREGGGR